MGSGFMEELYHIFRKKGKQKNNKEQNMRMNRKLTVQKFIFDDYLGFSD